MAGVPRTSRQRPAVVAKTLAAAGDLVAVSVRRVFASSQALFSPVTRESCSVDLQNRSSGLFGSVIPTFSTDLASSPEVEHMMVERGRRRIERRGDAAQRQPPLTLK